MIELTPEVEAEIKATKIRKPIRCDMVPMAFQNLKWYAVSNGRPLKQVCECMLANMSLIPRRPPTRVELINKTQAELRDEIAILQFLDRHCGRRWIMAGLELIDKDTAKAN